MSFGVVLDDHHKINKEISHHKRWGTGYVFRNVAHFSVY